MQPNQVEVLPPVNPVIAKGVLTEVDNLLEWQKTAQFKAEKAAIRLSRAIADISANGYWVIRGFESESDYAKKTFLQSESQYYILRRIGAVLRKYPIALLEEIGISKCQDLVRIHRHCSGTVDPNWFIWAKEEKRDDFRRRVQTYLGRALPSACGDQDGEIYHFKVWRDAMPIVNRALELAQLESGSESKSHNFILMCAEFCAGHNEEGSRMCGLNGLAIETIGAIIENCLDIEKDATVIDRLIGKVRSSLEKLKS